MIEENNVSSGFRSMGVEDKWMLEAAGMVARFCCRCHELLSPAWQQ